MNLDLRPDVELIGRYEGSGRTDETYLAKRADGAFVELTRLLYLTVAALNGQRNSTEVAEVVSAQSGLAVTADNVDFLIDKLTPLGLIGTEQPALGQPEMVLGLRVKRAVVPATAVRALTRGFQHLFHLPLVLAFTVAFGWVLYETVASGYLRSSVATLVNKPAQTLVVLGLSLLAMGFHELGHASACRFGKAKPGAIGGGLYLAWPVLYTDVTDGYRLKRSGRVRTDLGGVYFNAVLCVVFYGIFRATHYPPLILAIAASVLLMAEQLLPFVRFDGYWIVSDLAGVPDLFPRLGTALRKPKGKHMRDELKPYSRRIIRIWAGFTAVVLPIELALMLLLSATLAVTLSLGLSKRFDHVPVDLRINDSANLALDIIQGLLLALLLAGLIYALVFLTTKIVRYAAKRFNIVVGILVLAVLVAPVVWSAITLRITHS